MKTKLTRNGLSVYMGNHFMFSIAMTERARELLHDDGWDKGNESWLSYRERTAEERGIEKEKQIQLTQEIVDAYNKSVNTGDKK